MQTGPLYGCTTHICHRGSVRMRRMSRACHDQGVFVIHKPPAQPHLISICHKLHTNVLDLLKLPAGEPVFFNVAVIIISCTAP